MGMKIKTSVKKSNSWLIMAFDGLQSTYTQYLVSTVRQLHKNMPEPLCVLQDSYVFRIVTWQLFVESDIRETF